jgi:glucokinase
MTFGHDSAARSAALQYNLAHMLLAGDLGGTKTLLGLFSRAPLRPLPIAVQSFQTTEFADLVTMVEEFLQQQPQGRPPIEAACLGVAGPVIDDQAEITNVGWTVDGKRLAIALGLSRVRLLNDLVAVAHSVPVLESQELHVLQPGTPNLSGNAALIAAGTGMGQSYLFNDGRRLVPAPSEAGHSDFAARTARELELTAWLTRQYGRAEVEQVVSGIGLRNLYRFTHPTPCVDLDTPNLDLAIVVTTKGMSRTCEHCVDALGLFVSAYGAEAGNLALRSVATRGLYIGGGIAPRILPALSDGAFLATFRAKPPMRELLESIPVNVILNAQAGLLGAATAANAVVHG